MTRVALCLAVFVCLNSQELVSLWLWGTLSCSLAREITAVPVPPLGVLVEVLCSWRLPDKMENYLCQEGVVGDIGAAGHSLCLSLCTEIQRSESPTESWCKALSSGFSGLCSAQRVSIQPPQLCSLFVLVFAESASGTLTLEEISVCLPKWKLPGLGVGCNPFRKLIFNIFPVITA